MPGKHITRVDALIRKGRNVTKVQRICTKLVIFLSPTTNSESRSKLGLAQSQALALFL